MHDCNLRFVSPEIAVVQCQQVRDTGGEHGGDETDVVDLHAENPMRKHQLAPSPIRFNRFWQ